MSEISRIPRFRILSGFIHTGSYFRTVGFLLLFTIISILIRGYEYGGGNQTHYFHYAFKHVIDGIYPRDYLFKIHEIPYTVYTDAVIQILKIFGENQLIFFIVYTFFLFLFYAAIFGIVRHLFKKPYTAWTVLLLFIAPIPVGGSTIYTVEKLLIPRFIADVCLLLSLNSMLKNRTIVSPVLAGIGFLFHPLTMIPYLPIVIITRYLTFCSSVGWFPVRDFIRTQWKDIGLITVLFIGVSFPILSTFIVRSANTGIFIDHEWWSVISERLPYIFIWRWSLIDFIALTALALFYPVYTRFTRRQIPPLLRATAVTSGVLFVVSVFAAASNFRFAMQLQLARNLYPFIVLSIVYASGSFLEYISEKNARQIAVVIAVLAIFLCVPGRNRYGILWMNPRTDFQKVALWARSHTQKDSLFLVPLQSEGFRFWSKRSVFCEKKEGGDSLYDRNLAMEWDIREDLIEDADFTNEQFPEFVHTYHIDFVVTDKKRSGTPVFHSGTWYVYKP